MSGLNAKPDAAESGYFAVRGLLAKSVAEAARFIAERGGVAEGAPVVVRLIAQIASRFGVAVTQKLAAQAVPIIGALGGAAVNYAFIDHFQEVARAHFVMRNSNGVTAKKPSARLMIGFLAILQLRPEWYLGRRLTFPFALSFWSGQHRGQQSAKFSSVLIGGPH